MRARKASELAGTTEIDDKAGVEGLGMFISVPLLIELKRGLS